MERTLIILKPDAVQRGLVGEIIGRFERKGLQLAGMKLMQINKPLAEKHYAVHSDKPFYPGLIKYITSGPVVVMAIQGNNAITVCRKMMGKTFGFDAEPGSIRGDLSASKTFNLIHGSDGPETAAHEIGLYFGDTELLDYTRAVETWVYDTSSGKAE
jgi:nucleoside-diphosphate kinase